MTWRRFRWPQEGEDLRGYLSRLAAQLHELWMKLLQVGGSRDWWRCAQSCGHSAAQGKEIQACRKELAWYVYDQLVKPECATKRFLQVPLVAWLSPLALVLRLRELHIGKLAMKEAFKASAQEENTWCCQLWDMH